MRVLLDTHVAIWALASPHLIAPEVRDLIGNADNAVFVSAASVWEIAIKFMIAKRGAPPFSGTDAVRYFREAGYVLLDIRPEHAAAAERLPPLHSDPFDRLLIAQALAEPLRLVSKDPQVRAYGEAIIGW